MTNLVNQLQKRVSEETDPKGLQCVVFLKGGAQIPGFCKLVEENLFQITTQMQTEKGDVVTVDAFFAGDEILLFQVQRKSTIIQPHGSNIKLV